MQNQFYQQAARPLNRLSSPLGIVWGFSYGYQDASAEVFLPQVRHLGAGGVRVFLSWNQLEPEPGHYDWHALDTLLDQLDSPDEALIMLNSASTWATRIATEQLPPSPARDMETYYHFVYTVVSHCRGRVRYWHNDNEPSNQMFWKGTVEEYIAHLRVFYKAVKDADPEASVVLGGFDGSFNPFSTEDDSWGQEGLAFFDRVFREAYTSFDVFDMHLYTDPYLIPAQITHMRQKMRELGDEKPIFIAEYHGPGFFDFPENMQYLRLMGEWMSGVDASPEKAEYIQARIRAAMGDLYAQSASLLPQTGMFMQDCPPDLSAKRYRLSSRDLVMRTLLSLSVGAQKLYYWNLWADTSDKFDFMDLMFGRHKLMEYTDGHLTNYLPIAQSYQRMAQALADIEQVERIDVPEQPSLYLFEVQRGARGPLLVAWQPRDTFHGEDEPPIPFRWPWHAENASALDALGQVLPVQVRDGYLHLPLSLTPVFIEANK